MPQFQICVFSCTIIPQRKVFNCTLSQFSWWFSTLTRSCGVHSTSFFPFFEMCEKKFGSFGMLFVWFVVAIHYTVFVGNWLYECIVLLATSDGIVQTSKSQYI